MNTSSRPQLFSTLLTAIVAVAASLVLGLNLAAEADLAQQGALQQRAKQALHAAAEAQTESVELSEWALARL